MACNGLDLKDFNGRADPDLSRDDLLNVTKIRQGRDYKLVELTPTRVGTTS